MVEYTLEHMIFSVFLVGFLIFTSAFAIQYAGAQAQVTLRVELRNVVLLVREELLDIYRAADATEASRLVVSVPLPQAIQGRSYMVYLFSNGTLRGVVEQAMFDSKLPILDNVVWDQSIFRSGGATIQVTAEYLVANGSVQLAIA